MSAILAAGQVISVASTVATLLEDALIAAQKYAALQKVAADRGTPLTLDDLKTLQAETGVALVSLDAAIAKHEAQPAAGAPL